MSGAENMAYDRATLDAVENGGVLATFRLFSFASPTVSYGRLQTLNHVHAQVPAAWPAVQRPTGGGIVFHDNDLCLSLVWRHGQSPLPRSPREQYRWIHGFVLSALRTGHDVRMAACADMKPAAAPFETRECFTQPVGYDLLIGTAKVVGGALYRRREATLYQGSIQGSFGADLPARLQNAFRSLLS